MRTEIAADIMAVFGQYDIDGLKALHPQTVAALYQQAHRINRQRMRRTALGVMYGGIPNHISEIEDY